MMNIVHIVDFVHKSNNGIKEVVLRLQREQTKLGHKVYIFNVSSLNAVGALYPGEFDASVSSGFRNKMTEIVPDIVIFHSLYKWKYVIYSSYLRKKNIPYLIEPHGGTTCDNARKSRVVKTLANYFLFNRFIRNAEAIVYLNQYECAKCVFKHKRQNSLIIPNGIDIPHWPEREIREKNETIHFTFLARIDISHKGIDILLDAVEILSRKISRSKFDFSFYGSSSNEKDLIYLEKRIASMKSDLFFHGPVVGEDKRNAFLNTDIYVLTSRYEGMPLSVLEALSYGIPCIVTPQTNVQDIISSNSCGWITDLDAEAIAATLLKALDQYPGQQKILAANAQTAVRKFGWLSVASLSIREYAALLTK